MNNEGLVSIIIPLYNSEDTILHTLNSVYNQSYRPIEVILVDDGSNDNTLSIIEKELKECNDVHLHMRIIKQENKGAAAARNVGIRECKGNYLQFLDSDDLIAPDKIEKQMKYIYEHDISVYGRFRCFAKKEKQINIYEECPLPDKNNLLRDWLKGRFIFPASFLWKRNDVVKNGPWDETVSLNDDGEYVTRFLMHGGQLGFCHSAWCYYRTYLEKKRRVSNTYNRRSLLGAIKIIDNVCDYIKEHELDRIDKYKGPLVHSYFDILKKCYNFNDLQEELINKIKAIDGNFNLKWYNYDGFIINCFGVNGRYSLINILKKVYRHVPFRLIYKVNSLNDLYKYDHDKENYY